MNEWHICIAAMNNSYFDELATNSVTVYRSQCYKYWCISISNVQFTFCVNLHYSNGKHKSCSASNVISLPSQLPCVLLNFVNILGCALWYVLSPAGYSLIDCLSLFINGNSQISCESH
jgi:hypothetical protein